MPSKLMIHGMKYEEFREYVCTAIFISQSLKEKFDAASLALICKKIGVNFVTIEDVNDVLSEFKLKEIVKYKEDVGEAKVTILKKEKIIKFVRDFFDFSAETEEFFRKRDRIDIKRLKDKE